MEKKLILALFEHRVYGYVLNPYIAEIQDKQDYYVLVERIIYDDIRKRPNEFNDEQKKLVKIIEEYSDSELVKAFSKKRLTNQEFISQLTTEMISVNIRPYIERRIVRIIELIRETNIEVYFKDSPKQLYRSDKIILENKPAEAVFNFIRTDEEFKYFLSISHNLQEMKLTGKSGIILANTPCHLVLDNHLLIFNDIDGKKLSPFFRNEYINIPKTSEKLYLEKFVTSTIKKFRVKCQGFSIVEESPKPVVQLALEADLFYQPILNLKFDYGNNRIIPANQPVEISVTLENTDENIVFYKIIRDMETENKAIAYLLDNGFENNTGSFYKMKGSESDLPEEMLGDLVNFLNFNVLDLTDQGFHLIQKFFDKQYYTQSISLKTLMSKREDWFDINISVELGEYTIPFVRLRRNILANKREFQLPNGQYVILPKEWFARYSDLFYFGKQNGDSFICNKQHLPILHDTFKSVNQEYFNMLQNLQKEEENKVIETLPQIQAVLRPYQVDGFNWMLSLFKNNIGACLADDMGLGKTLQTLTLLKKVIEKQLEKVILEDNPETTNSSLIVLPASLVHNWFNEIQKFAPSLSVLKYIGINRSINISEFKNYQIILTTYGVVRNEYEQLRNFDFLYLILDESQTIKNPDSKIFQAVRELNAKNRLVLTGTPIENSLTDLWSQIDFLNPGYLGELSFFKEYFSIPIERDGDEIRRDKLKRLIQPLILRRTKKEVAPDLPELNEQVLYCSMSESQKNYYEEAKSKARNEILDSIDKKGIEFSSMLVLNAMNQLRQIANHPSMVDNNYGSDSGKFEEVTLSLENMFQEGHKVLIFSSYVKHLEIYRQFFEEKNWVYSMLTGSTLNREQVVDKFQKDLDCKFFLISLKAGGVGLNLTAADYVFMLDPWWNPAAEMQAINRAHRIGQTQNVFVYRFISAETIEEKIVKLQQKKSELADVFINNNNNPFKSMSKETILEFFE